MRKIPVLFITLATLAVAASQDHAGLERITAEGLRRDVSYLASDELAGRATPSPGLDKAADYIAEQFRRAGLKPAGPEGSFFQTALFNEIVPDLKDFRMTLEAADEAVEVSAPEMRAVSTTALEIRNAPLLRLPGNGAIPPVAGAIVAGEERRYGDSALLEELQTRHPMLIVLFSRRPGGFVELPVLDDPGLGHAPVIRIHGEAAAGLLRGKSPARLSLHMAQPGVRQVRLNNVAGVLPGSDPALREQYVAVSAHYDHLGGEFHGANDNASGTASVMAIAAAMAVMEPHPRRSVLFLLFFGEEEGLLGAYYYARHPLVPLSETVAEVNLEQMGRTDDVTGTKLKTLGMTGADYSDLASTLGAGARKEAITMFRVKDADDYFDRSDNLPFAEVGIVSTTLVVAFDFPDYHGTGDSPEKLDYGNMAKVDRGLAAGLLEVANAPVAPHWSDAPRAAVYRLAGHQ